MGLFDGLRNVMTGSNAPLSLDAPPKVTSGFDQWLDKAIETGGSGAIYARLVKEGVEKSRQDSVFFDSSINRSVQSIGGIVGLNDYGVKGRRQYSAERRRLLDLYTIVLNNGDVRTAVTHLRNEIFRRGLDWEPAFEFKCDLCEETYSTKQYRKLKGKCDCVFTSDPYEDDEGNPRPPIVRDAIIDCQEDGEGYPLRKPDRSEIKRVEKFLDKTNYFGQSLETLLRMCEDDINVVDDAFIYLRKKYEYSDEQFMLAKKDRSLEPEEEVVSLFRLDPTLVEFDLDTRGVPGQAHHLCVFHRDVLLDVPIDEGWDIEWKGICPACGLKTYPVFCKYSEQQSGVHGASRPQVLYLLEEEIIHWSRYSPTETYGFPPVLSIYEKALTLIGMDRYLYDYFYERKVPQGVISVSTDDIASFENTKAVVEAKMQQDPHYIPWMAISSKNGQGRMEFVRFAYSLDELDYLPVRDEIRERIAGLYGVSQIWMQSTEGIGGLNNESQQLTVMSRVVEGAQRSYHTDVFPKLERALHVGDWHLQVKTPEESDELLELQIESTKAGIAQMMAGMGFGVEYDSESREFTFSGRVLSAEEQQKKQMEMGSPFGAGGKPTPVGGGNQGSGFGGGAPSQPASPSSTFRPQDNFRNTMSAKPAKTPTVSPPFRS